MPNGLPSTKSNPKHPMDAPAGDAPTLEDRQLIAQTLAGDRSAFDQLVLRYQDRLFGSLLRITGNADDAEEVSQEAFVQAYQKLDRFKQASAFYTWLYRIAFNRAVSRRRKRRERTSLDSLREVSGIDPVSNAPQADAPAMQQEQHQQVHEALGKLGEESRQVMVLRELEGFDYQQIADLLSIPVGTVRSRLFRARMQMKEFLSAMFEA